MSTGLTESFRASFQSLVCREPHGAALQLAALQGKLGDWTRALTRLSVDVCQEVGWRSSAKGHSTPLLPIERSEYLGMDLMAFAPGNARWLFPMAAMEFENSTREDQIAYSLWKVLSVRAALRLVFCYRKEAAQGPALIRNLNAQVIDAMSLEGRLALEGETAIIVGSRSDAETFPFGFFSWWQLDTNTGKFSRI